MRLGWDDVCEVLGTEPGAQKCSVKPHTRDAHSFSRVCQAPQHFHAFAHAVPSSWWPTPTRPLRPSDTFPTLLELLQMCFSKKLEKTLPHDTEMQCSVDVLAPSLGLNFLRARLYLTYFQVPIPGVHSLASS